MCETKIIKVVVDNIPVSCGECPLMMFDDGTMPICCALPKNINSIAGNPYDMMYRRSDCPLFVESVAE